MVLNRAADLLVEHGWTSQRTYRSTDRRVTAVQAITQAIDELAGPGLGSADLLTDALDAVCLHVFGQRHGNVGVSVAQWERRPDRQERVVFGTVVPAQSALTAEAVVSTLRQIATTPDSDGRLRPAGPGEA